MGFEFKINADGAITGYTGKMPSDISIPKKIDRKIVREIKSSVFESENIKNIFIPATIERLNPCQFKGCRNLESVVFDKNSKIESIPRGCFSFAFVLKNVASKLVLLIQLNL